MINVNFQISSLEVLIAELREVCIKEKHIDPDKDVDGSGTVDFGDLVGTLANWGPC